MQPKVPTFAEQLAGARSTAVHLEMRDSYSVAKEAEAFAAWQNGFRHDPDDRASWWRPWLTLIEETVARGVEVRRVRIVSEPVSEYIRFEHSGTFTNIAAGEQIRWLSRRQASDIALPGNDFWLFDDQLVRFNHFTGAGESVGPSFSDDPAVTRLCLTAFATAWERAVPHEKYSV